jgi:hypothetical protein
MTAISEIDRRELQEQLEKVCEHKLSCVLATVFCDTLPVLSFCCCRLTPVKAMQSKAELQRDLTAITVCGLLPLRCALH